MIIIRSVFQNRQIEASTVRELRWNAKIRGGTLKFRTLTSNTTLHLHGFARDDQVRIIQSARRLIPANVQTGWDEFCHLVALPLREGRSARQPGRIHIDPSTFPATRRVFVTRRRYDRIFLMLSFVGVLVACAIWWVFDNPRGFAALAYVPFFWCLLRFSTPKQGEWKVKWAALPETKFFVLVHLAKALMCLSAIALSFARIDPMIAMWTGMLFALCCCAISIRSAIRRERRQRFVDKAATPDSVARWEAAELTDAVPA